MKKKLRKFQPGTIRQWAKNWTKNNVRSLRLRYEGNIFDAETCELQASIAKDFIAVNGLLNIQFMRLSPPSADAKSVPPTTPQNEGKISRLI